MNFWHMQLHPGKDSSEEFNRKKIKSILENHSVIGMGKQWKNDRGQPNYFRHEVKVGDIVLIRNNGPLALVKVTGECFDRKPTKDVWFEIARKVEVISYDGYLLKDEFQSNIEQKWFAGFFNPSTLQSVNHSEFIRYWYMKEHIKEMINLFKYKKQIVLQGPPGTGKTYTAKRIADALIEPGSYGASVEGKRYLVQFHPSYTYEDFVRGIVAKTEEGQISYQIENKLLAKVAKEAKDNQKANYVLIIDEINRANLPSVLGELIYALEYRDEDVQSLYTIGIDSAISLPDNLYIIGTMNTADRSVGHIDYAIRRRFAFINFLPDITFIEDMAGQTLFNKVQKLFSKEYLAPDFERKDAQLGHSYFMATSQEELSYKLDYEIKPILYEYLKDGILLENAKAIIDGLSV